MSRRLPFALLMALVTVAACDPTGSGATARPGAPTSGPVATPGSVAERGVIQGRVTTADGRPIGGAEIHYIGYLGTVGQHDGDLVTDADGRYRVEVPDGLYEISGDALIAYDGGTYRLALAPANESCDAALSADGIAQDFVLRLVGPRRCLVGADPDNDGSWYGAAVHIWPNLAQFYPPEAVITMSFAPDGPLADGSTGSAFTMTRTVAALTSTSGSLDDSATLYDIPLGRYTVTATITSGAATSPLLVWPERADAASAAALLTFEPAQFYPYGIREQTLTLMPPG